MLVNHAVSSLPVELWEEIIALTAYDPSPFALIDQCPHVHSRRARKLLRLGQENFHKRISTLSCVCKSWRNLTEKLKDPFLEVHSNDELRRLTTAQSGHRCLNRRRLDIYSSSWCARTSYDLVLHDLRAVLSNTQTVEVLSLLRAGLGFPMMPDKFLLEISDLLHSLKALEYATAPATGVDGRKISLLAVGYRSLQYLSCDIMILPDALSDAAPPAFPHLKTLRTFVHTPAGSPDGLEEWLTNWEMPALKGLSLTYAFGHEDWRWLCALLRRNGRSLEYVQFSVNPTSLASPSPSSSSFLSSSENAGLTNSPPLPGITQKFDYATTAPFKFMEYCPRLHTFAGTNIDQLLLDIPAQHPPIHKIVVLEVHDGDSTLTSTLRSLCQRIWRMLRDVDHAAGGVLQFGDVTKDDLDYLTYASESSVEALWLLIITMSKYKYQVMDTDGREIKTYLGLPTRPDFWNIRDCIWYFAQ